MRKGVPQIGLSFFVNGFFFCSGASTGRPYHIRNIPSFLTHFIFSRFLRRVFSKKFYDGWKPEVWLPFTAK